LTLGSGATIGGTTDALNMILINGALSDRGVKKIYASGNSDPFTYPIGVSGKYTPVTFDFSVNLNSNASITVRPINDLHKSITTSPTNYLNYYWGVITSGLSAAYTADHQYYYTNDLVIGSELSYTAQRYDVVGNTWSVPTGSVDAAGNYFSFTGITSSLDGEYTAGDLYSAQPPLYSITSGNWSTNGTWSLTSGGASCGCTPAGNPLTIESGHTVTLSTDGADAYSVNILGELYVGMTTFHDLGHVAGGGRLTLEATTDGMFVLPGGEYDEFMANTASTIEFTGSNSGTLPLKPGNIYKPFNNVEFTGSGIKYMSAENMKAVGNLSIANGTVLNNTLYNKNLYLLGNWTDLNTTTDGFVPGTGMVSFIGTTAQLFNVSRAENFYNVTINNTNAIVLDRRVDLSSSIAGMTISKYLYLTSGNIVSTTVAPVKLSSTSTLAVVGGSSSSFVDGPLQKNIISGQSFAFPSGDGTRFGKISLLSTSVSSSPQYWTAQYYNSDPHAINASATLTSPLTAISTNEYWDVDRPSGGTANIQLRWDDLSGNTATSGLRSLLRVVEYDGVSAWTERSTSTGVSGNATAGTITTSTPVSADNFVFTIGVSGVTATITNTTAVSICNNGEIASIPVTLTGTSPWSLTYQTTNGTTTKSFTQTGIASSSYTIQLTGTDLGGAGIYTLSLISVSDASSPGVCSSATKSITVKTTYIPNITGTFSVGSGEARSYSTTANVGSTFSWTWSGTAPASYSPAFPSASNPLTLTINSTGTYNLEVTETSSTGCTASDIQTITVSALPTPSISPTTANVCQGSSVTYSTPIVGTHTYAWTVTGGTPLTGTGSSITVLWGVAGTGTVSVDEVNGVLHGYDSLSVNISSSISDYVATAAASSVCVGTGTNIQLLTGSQSGVTYQLRDATTHIAIGGTVAGSSLGSPIDLPTGVLSADKTFEVYAFNSGCSATMTGTPTVTVIASPVAPTASDQGHCIGSTVADLVSTPPGGSVTDWYATSSAGSVLTTSTVLTATTYYGESRNTTSGCVSTTRTPVVVTLNAIPVFTATGSTATICEGDPYTLSTSFTSIATPYDIDIQLDGSSVTLPISSGLTDNPFIYSPTLVWTGTTDPNMINSYTVTVIDSNGCTSTSGIVSVTVKKRPETGPQYHIPNDF